LGKIETAATAATKEADLALIPVRPTALDLDALDGFGDLLRLSRLRTLTSSKTSSSSIRFYARLACRFVTLATRREPGSEGLSG